MDNDTHMAEAAGPAEAEFLPPSIDEAALLAGDSYSYFSPVPPRLLPKPAAAAAATTVTTAPAAAVPCVLGVDEAGRGPVLGPMVYGVFYAPAAEADVLLRGGRPAKDDGDGEDGEDGEDGDKDDGHNDDERYRFDDSKVLSAATRAGLMEALCRPGSSLHRSCGWATAALSARDIGADMLAPPSAAGANLNAQAADATMALIRGVLARGVRVTDVFVDTVGPPASYQKKLQQVFPSLRITVAKKADSLYPCVSAASVCAKVTRDVALEVLYRRHAAVARAAVGAASDSTSTTTEPDWGSGYPSDGRCTAWLRRNMHPVFGWGPECRFSWGTAKDMLEDDDNSGSSSSNNNGKKKSSSANNSKKKNSNSVRVEWPLPDDQDGAGRMTDFFVTSVAAPNKPPAAEEVDELGSWFGRPVGLEAF